MQAAVPVVGQETPHPQPPNSDSAVRTDREHHDDSTDRRDERRSQERHDHERDRSRDHSRERSHSRARSHERDRRDPDRDVRRDRDRDRPEPGKLFLGGVSYETNTEGIRRHFEPYGEITDAVVMKDAVGRSRGFAFVTFRDPSVVDRVMQDIHVIDGRQVSLL